MLERIALLSLISVVAMPGCADTMAEIAANSTTNILKKAVRSFDSESDPWLARETAVGNLKFAEGVLEAAPDNGDLMVLIGRNYALFTFSFLQDDLEGLKWGSPEYEVLQKRSIDFQTRARGYAIRRMQLDFEDFDKAVLASGDRFDQILALCEPDKHVEALYFLAFAWGNLIRLSPDDPNNLADLPRVGAIMQWVRERRPDFENGGPHLYFGDANIALPKDAGGNPEAAKAAFDAAVAVTGGRYLMSKAIYARSYMRAVGDREGYQRLLQDVLDADDNIMPEQRLANTLAKRRAKRWLAETSTFFSK